MERYNSNGWNVWVHPLWNALLSNPAYYYYYTAKAALLNQVFDKLIAFGHDFADNVVHGVTMHMKLKFANNAFNIQSANE